MKEHNSRTLNFLFECAVAISLGWHAGKQTALSGGVDSDTGGGSEPDPEPDLRPLPDNVIPFCPPSPGPRVIH